MQKGLLAPGLLAGCVLVFSSLSGCGGSDSQPGEEPPGPAAASFDEERAFEDVRAQVEIGPRPAGSAGSRREVGLIRSRLRQAEIAEIAVQRPRRNVVATIPGREAGTVVIGAHHDTKDGIPGFVGANDGASGVAVLLELARSLPNPYLGPSLTLAFFDAEEARGYRPFALDGIRGSRQFVRLAETGGGQGSPALGEIKAMFLLDLVGDCDLRVPREGFSDEGLYGLLEGDTFEGKTSAVLDDHVPFVDAGVPAVNIIDFTYGPGAPPGAYWHTPEDTLDKVCPESLGEVGRAVIGALGTL